MFDERFSYSEFVIEERKQLHSTVVLKINREYINIILMKNGWGHAVA
jgi:hypothetical protein